MEWTPVFTILATGAVSLAVVWLTQALTGRRDARALMRADRIALSNELRSTSRVVAELFLEQAGKLRQMIIADRGQYDDDEFEDGWYEHWEGTLDLPWRLAIEAIPDAVARAQLTLICDGMGASAYPRQVAKDARRAVSDLAELGQSVAASYMRGEKPDSTMLLRLDRLRGAMKDIDDQYWSQVGAS